MTLFPSQYGNILNAEDIFFFLPEIEHLVRLKHERKLCLKEI